MSTNKLDKHAHLESLARRDMDATLEILKNTAPRDLNNICKASKTLRTICRINKRSICRYHIRKLGSNNIPTDQVCNTYRFFYDIGAFESTAKRESARLILQNWDKIKEFTIWEYARGVRQLQSEEQEDIEEYFWTRKPDHNTLVKDYLNFEQFFLYLKEELWSSQHDRQFDGYEHFMGSLFWCEPSTIFEILMNKKHMQTYSNMFKTAFDDDYIFRVPNDTHSRLFYCLDGKHIFTTPVQSIFYMAEGWFDSHNASELGQVWASLSGFPYSNSFSDTDGDSHM
jgi:hypothetical protein